MRYYKVDVFLIAVSIDWPHNLSETRGGFRRIGKCRTAFDTKFLLNPIVLRLGLLTGTNEHEPQHVSYDFGILTNA